MDYLLVAALVAPVLSLAVGFGAGRFFRGHRVVILPSVAVQFGPDHEHKAIIVDANGWRCECGQHVHRYISRADGERCACGKAAP